MKPRLVSALATSVSTTVEATGYLPWSFASISFTTGTSTFDRTVYVTWDTLRSTATAGTFHITGSINDHPYAKATATVS